MGRLQAIEQSNFGGVNSRANPIVLPPSQFLLLRNWVPRTDGHLELREGYSIQPPGAGMSGGTGPIHSMSPYTVAYHGTLVPGTGPGGLPFANGAQCIFFWRGIVPFVRLLDGGTCPTANPSIRGNPIASSARWQYALGKDGYLYMHNGTDMKFFDGVYLRDIGLPVLTQAQAGKIRVAEGLAAPTAAQADGVTFDFLTPTPGTPNTQANAISGLMYMAYFDPNSNVLAPCAEPLSGNPFPSGHTAPAGYDNSFLRVNNLPLPTKAGAVILLYYPGGNVKPILQPSAVCNFYPRYGGGSYASQFEYSHSTDTYGGGQPLPGSPTASYTLLSNAGLMFNPELPIYGGSSLAISFPGWTGDTAGHIYPMVVAGVNSAGGWDGTAPVIWSGATGPGSGPGWTMTVEGNLSIPEAGDYDFYFVHDDGALIGFGDGATPLSGFIDPAFQQLTADKGYPVACSRQTAGKSSDLFSVTFPAPGLYHFEIDYCNWETAQTCCLYNGDGTAIIPGAPSTIAVSEPSYLTTSFGTDYAALTMLDPSTVNVNLTGHGYSTGDVIVLSLHSHTVKDNVYPVFSPVEWSSNGPFKVNVVDANNFTFSTPEASLYDGAHPITILKLVTVTTTSYTIDTDNSGTPATSANGFDENQSGQILLPSPLDPLTGAGSLIPASSIGGTQPGYQFYASIYNPLTGHVGNRVAIGARIAPTTPTTFEISTLPDLSVPFLGKQEIRWGDGAELKAFKLGNKQGQIVGRSTSPGDSEWCLLIGRTGDGGEVPYAVIDSAGNWIYATPGQTSITIDYAGIDGNSELPTQNYIPPPFVCFWREGERLCGAIDKQPFVYRSGSELDATTGIFVGDPAQAWDPAAVETFPTAQAIFGGFGFMQESWVFTKGQLGQLSELSGEVVWNGPYNFGIIGAYAFDHGWKSLPFWISRDKQLCTMLPNSDGPIPISTDYEATLLKRIGDKGADPSVSNNHATATGTGTPQTTATLTPGTPMTLALFVANADGATTPSGWTRMSSGSKIFSKALSSAAPLSVSNPSTGVGAPSNEWANIIATIARSGNPAVVQTVGTGIAGYSHAIAFPSNLTAGNCIIASFSGNSPNAASGSPTVTDSQGNKYVVVEIVNTVGSYNVSAFLAVAIGCKAGANTVTIGTTLKDGYADIFELSGISTSAPDYPGETELVYFRDPQRLVEVLRIKCVDNTGTPFVVIHDFSLIDPENPFGQGYEADYEDTLSTDFTSARIRDFDEHDRMWAGGADARFYQFYLGGNDNGTDFTADAISLRYVSGERSALKTLEWYGDENIQWYSTDNLNAVYDSDSWDDLSDQARPFPGDEGNAHYQTDLMTPEVIHLFLWAQLVSHPALPNPADPMTLNDPPHMPLETYGRLYLAAPLIGDTRGR
jgi:hypothetical protein